MDKMVELFIPGGKTVKVTGNNKDKSVLGAIELSGGYYEKNVMAVLSGIIKPDFSCLDVGANVGVLSMALADMAFKGSVVSVEAGRANFNFLKKNVADNGFDNVIIVNKAASDYQGETTFSYVEEVAGCSFISTTSIKVGEQETVVVTTIDDIVRDLELERIDFIKLDVEGGERKALLGAMHTISKFSPILLIEWNPVTIQRFYGEDPELLYDFLRSNWSTIEMIGGTDDAPMQPIKSYADLCGLTNIGKGWEDLICLP